MCLNPSTILNPSRFYRPNSGQYMYLSVPCGHCSECISMYASEWRLRARYEALDTSNYVLFDTLTYSNGNLPHVSDMFSVPKNLDFPCFSKYDVQCFLKRLRSYLSNHGYDVKEKLRYFIVSEYGNDIRYTRRPHYHALFFVSCSIPPLVLSRAISKCWSFGRTDGVKYRGSSYVLNRNVFSSDSNIVNPVVGYVTKYISKQFSYSSLVNSRLSRLKEFDYDTYKLVKPFVSQFHVQSLNFGYKSLSNRDPYFYVENPFLALENKQHYINYVSLPMSLQRKIFYTYSAVNGRVLWSAKPALVDYKVTVAERQIHKLACRFSSKLGIPLSQSTKYATVALFAHGRLLNSFKSIRDTLCDSYNINSGLRNYACIDRGYISKKRCFSNQDYGSTIDGFKCTPIFKFDCSFDDPSSLHTVSDIDNLFCYKSSFVEDINNRLSVKLHSDGDAKLGVLKVLERLNNIHKTKLLC